MIRFIALLLAVTYAQVGQASMSDQDFSDLKTELMSLISRVDALEAENKALRESVVSSASTVEKLVTNDKSSSWTKNVKIKGDLRYRYENIDAERSDTRERKQDSGPPCSDCQTGRQS